MRLISDSVWVDKYQQVLQNTLLSAASESVTCHVGYHGGSVDNSEVAWLEDYGIWYLPRKLDNKYWNAFGLIKPQDGKGVSITGEVNFPLSGINRTINSAFVESDGKIFIVHRGRMGGGTKGVDRSLFINNYQGDWCEFLDGDQVATGALVGSLYSGDLILQISHFVREYDRIKQIGKNNSTADVKPPNTDSFSKEFGGIRRGYTVSEMIEAQCNHGIVVNSCKEYLARKGFKVANDMHRDLVLLDSHQQERVVFEFKTALSTTSIYGAIGQLYYHKRDCVIKPAYVMVLPEGDTKIVQSKLKVLGIDLITYKLNGSKVSFRGIDELLNKVL